MELIFLLVGVGLGFVGSQVTGSLKKSEGSTASVPKEADISNLARLQEDVKPLQESIPSLKEEPKPRQEEPQPIQEGIQPLKEELKQTQLAYEMAKEMSYFKGGFLARTAHELRSPLSSLIGMHQLILSDLCDSPEEAREFVAQANTSALKMVKVLDEVIAVSKAEHGTNRIEILSLPLSQVFEEVYRLTHMQAANSNLQFEVVRPEPEIHVLADLRRLQQALVGLVDTAIAKLSDRKEGSIKLSATCSPESKEVYIWLDVQCPTSAWSEVVDLLSTTPEMEKQPGSISEVSPGLTLLMVQSLVEVMQGRLEVLPLSLGEGVAYSAADTLTRLQCSMPLGTPETVESVLA